MLEIWLLGQFSIRLSGNPVDIPARPAQSLLAYLVLNAGILHRRERLAGIFWPEASESNARTSLRHYLWRLRKELRDDGHKEEQYFNVDKISISFNPQSDFWVDALHLEKDIPNNNLSDSLIESLSLYGGELLPGFYENWVVLERERYRAIFEDRMHVLLDQLISSGHFREVLEWAERWIAFGQVPEPAYRALMVAYNALGDISSVASTYRRCNEALRLELGVKPSAVTRSIYQDLIEGKTSPSRPSVVGERGASGVLAVRTLLHRWEQRGENQLDLPSLAMVYACRSDLHFEPKEIALLIRSALHHGVEVAPWLQRAGSSEVVEGALRETLAAYPPSAVRMRVVEAARDMDDASHLDFLMEITAEEEASSVRSAAAVAAAQHGKLDQVVEILGNDIKEKDDPSALAALVAVADEVGLPDHFRDYPRLSVGLALAQRRWKRDRGLILNQVWRAALITGVVTAFFASLIPFYRRLLDVELYNTGLERFPLPGWILTSFLSGLFIGFIQGASSGFALGLADSLWRGKSKIKRLLLGAVSGLYYAFMWIIFSLTLLMEPTVEPELYIPIYILFGFYFGVGLSLVAPRLGTTVHRSDQIRRIFLAILFSVPGSMALIYLTYLDRIRPFWLSFLMEIIAITLGFGLSFTNSKLQKRFRKEA
jgi:DNA-binding SARP family transcriptional activator